MYLANSTFVSDISFIEIIIIGIWIVSEIILYKSIKKSKTDDSVWLVLNIFLPVIACIIYKLTHRTTTE